MSELVVVNPVGELRPREADAAIERVARPATLDGQRVGLYWNGKTHGDHALHRVAELLAVRYPAATFRHYIGDKGGLTRFASTGLLTSIGAECDVVVGSTGDCGSCTSWLIRDMTRFEQEGVATVCFVSSGFVDDAVASAAVFGCPTLALAEVPQPFTNRDVESIHAMVDEAVDALVDALTDEAWSDGRQRFVAPSTAHLGEPASIEVSGLDLLDAVDEFNRVAIDQGWGDGLTLVPPVRSKVDRMVEASGREGSEIVGFFAPAMGVGTIEKVAVNAVMAGLSPDAFPVLLAAIDCVLDPTMGLRTWAMSTGPQAPFVLVSGPIATRIGMNSGVCALGPGAVSAVNIAIGRALHLVIQNIGHAFPGVGDLDTIGTPLKFSACVSENEARNPWPSYRIEQGFDPEQSTVTVNVPYGMVEVFDFDSKDADSLVASFGTVTRSVAASPHPGNWLIKTNAEPDSGYPFNGMSQNLVLLCPEHAATFADAGWSTARVRSELHRVSRVSFREAMVNKSVGLFERAHPHLSPWLDQPDAPVSLYKSPDSFDLFVVGADAGRSLYCPGGTHSVTKAVRG